MSRPRFPIDKKRLYNLRNEACLSQRELGIALVHRLGLVQDDATAESNLRRIELTGDTSRKRATALAEILGVSVEVLQGIEAPAPENYIDRIAALLQQQLANGENAALQRALEREIENGPEDALRWLATDIGERIEAAQLGRNPAEIADLVALTGLPEAELMRPANVLGHWIVMVTSRGCNRTDVVRGIGALGYHIQEVVGDRLNHFGSDNSIRMWRDDPWIRIEAVRLSARDVMRIDFTRCHADGSGLRWASASWRDWFFLEDRLKRWAYDCANFVTDWDGHHSPGDLQRLRFLVSEHDGSYSRVLRQMVITGHVDEIPDFTRKSFTKDGSSHHLHVSWLTSDLRRALQPHLAQFPARCWSISIGAGIDIHLTTPRFDRNIMPGIRYRIILAEESTPGQFASVPWRISDRESLKQTVEKWLKEPSPPHDDNAPSDTIPRFEAF